MVPPGPTNLRFPVTLETEAVGLTVTGVVGVNAGAFGPSLPQCPTQPHTLLTPIPPSNPATQVVQVVVVEKFFEK